MTGQSGPVGPPDAAAPGPAVGPAGETVNELAGEPAAVEPELEAVPASAASVFSDRLPLAERLAELLATDGVERGAIGPRETPRLWSRHLLNCAVLTDLLPEGARVVDVGSGAGLPGLVLAVRRPDLRVDLVDTLHRRIVLLEEFVAALGLDSTVRVVEGRVEDASVRSLVGRSDWVTARALAPLDRLARWCLPLLSCGGELLAMKGASAEDEVAKHRAVLRRLGADDVRVVHCGADVMEPPTTVVRMSRRVAPSRKGS